jgi:hypothetical protein
VRIVSSLRLSSAPVELKVFLVWRNPLGCYGFNSDQSALYMGPLHRRKVLQIIGDFHRDLGAEEHVLGHLGGEPLQKLKALCKTRFQTTLLFGVPRIGDVRPRVRIEIVIGEHHEAEAGTVELVGLLEDCVVCT